jgi:hypothetical protein
MPIYTVNRADFKKNYPGREGGEFSVYDVEVKGEDDMYTQAELVQKSTTTPPAVGDSIDGTISPGKFGMQLKRNYAQNAGGGGFQGRERDPKVQKQIVRQSCQKTAAVLCQVLSHQQKLPADFGPSNMGFYFSLVDALQADVDRQ